MCATERLLERQLEEILKYKWIESEKVGYDIGFERAAREWIRKYSFGLESSLDEW